jgi:hypothetical protein
LPRRPLQKWIVVLYLGSGVDIDSRRHERRRLI